MFPFRQRAMIRYNVVPDRAPSQRSSPALLRDSSIIWLGFAVICTVIISGLLIVYRQSSPQSLDHAHVTAHAQQQEGGQDVVKGAPVGQVYSMTRGSPAGQALSMRGSSSLITKAADARPATIMKTASSVTAASSSPPHPSLAAMTAASLTVTRGSKCSLASTVQVCSHRYVHASLFTQARSQKYFHTEALGSRWIWCRPWMPWQET